MMPRALGVSLASVTAVIGLGLVALVKAPGADQALTYNIEVASAPPVVSCPGPQLVPVGDVGAGGDLASEPTVRAIKVFGSSPRAVGAGSAVDADVAAQVETMADGDIAGWAGITCGSPSTDQWLVGGATSLGSSARLVLSNPSTAASEVTVTLYGPLGEVADRIVVAVGAGAQEDRLIEGSAPELAALVVRVAATGPGVVAALQDSRLSGFQPAGTDWVGPSALATDLVVPAATMGLEGAETTLRLMAPDGANVSLTMVSNEGIEPWSIGRALALEPGVVTEVVVPSEALVAIEVSADSPVLAAARTVVSRPSLEGVEGDIAFDDAWVPGQVVSKQVLTATAPTDNATVAVYSPFATSVSFVAAGTQIARVDLEPRTVRTVVLPVPAGTVVTTDAEAVWTMLMTSQEGFLTALSPISSHGQSVTLTVVRDPHEPGA